MSKAHKRKDSRKPDSADRYLGKRVILSTALMLTVALLSPVKFVRYHAETQPVKLFKMASACDPGDWGCELGEFHSHGGRFDKKGRVMQ